MNLRPYQKNAFDSINKGFVDFRKQLAVLPTGGGKTILFAHLAAHEKTHNGQRTLILAHREELIDQAIDKIQAATGIRAGKEKAEFQGDRSAKVVVASVQSMMSDKRLGSWAPDHFGLVVCDEAHHSISKSWQKVLNHFDQHAKILGVTATPDRGDKKNLGQYFENIAAEVHLFDLINDGYLAPIALKAIPLDIDLSGVGSKAGDFDKNDLSDALEPWLEQIATEMLIHAPMRKILVFLPLIKTSQKFAGICADLGLRSAHVDGYSKERKEILERYENDDFDVLSNAMLLTEGYDCPSVDCVVVLRPTRSRPLYSQMIGRGTRTAPRKENLLVLDFLWHHSRHQLASPAHLIAKSDEEAKMMVELSQKKGGQVEQDLEELATEATHEREDALRKQLDRLKGRKAKHISADQFAIQHDSLAVAEYEPVMGWEREGITAPQKRVLNQHKLDLDTVRGKGHASQIIGIIKGEERNTPASPKQRSALARGHFQGWENATVADAKAFFRRRYGRK